MPFVLPLDSTVGAMFVGFNLSCVIFGIMSMQAFRYFQCFPNDRFAYKALVMFLWTLELVDQTLIGHSVYTYTVSHFADPVALITKKIVWSLLVQVALGSFVGTIVKGCFCMRVWRFSGRNVPVTGTILVLVCATFALALVYTVKAFTLTSILYIDNLKFMATLALAAGVGTDILTAMALLYFLRKLRTGHKKSDSLVNLLTIYAVNTGALTSAVSLTTLLLYNFKPHAFYFMASYFCLGKLYTISLLCTLNTRKTIRGRGTDRAGNSSNPSGNMFLLVSPHGRSASQKQQPQSMSMQIDVHKEVSISADVESPMENYKRRGQVDLYE
ncbi:hypothetical protein AX17_006665 [Amanita inopinata Kibby_2008]|nr:hypothetical protein AX17_006665 [Amanita inopinata Kibby_2008]